MYVDELVGPHTVNTMPLATLMAVADHGHVKGPTAEHDPTDDLDTLAEAGVDLGAITDALLVDGVNQFEEAMNRLLAGIEERRQAAVTGKPPTIEARLPTELTEPVAARVKAAVSEDVARRIWRKDPSLWGGDADTPEITDRLGWLTVSETMLEHAPELEAFVAECRDAGYTDAVLLGMGGSSLGPEVLRQSFATIGDGLRLQVLDSTHPDAIAVVQNSVEIAKTLFIVSSKSGGTVETLSHYRHFRALAGPEQFVVVTDPGSPLQTLAEQDGLRRTFPNPPDIGGRYSVLSYFGLVPAALMGVDIKALLHSCQVGEQNCAHYGSSEQNSGLWLGAVLGELARHGRDKLTFVVSEPIQSFGLWVEQLIAESTGKQGRGILPVADEPLGGPDEYGDDRVIIYLRNADDPSEDLDEAVAKLADAGQPTLTLATGGATDLGRIFFVSEFAVAVVGWALEINPFDQPNVQEAKDATKRVLASGSVPELGSATDQALGALLLDGAPPALRGRDGLPGSVRAARRRDRAAAAHDPRQDPCRRHLRLRPALFALNRPAAQGRPTGWSLPSAGGHAAHRRADSRWRLLVRDADRGASGRRSADLACPQPAGRAGPARGRSGGGGAGSDTPHRRTAAGSVSRLLPLIGQVKQSRRND